MSESWVIAAWKDQNRSEQKSLAEMHSDSFERSGAPEASRQHG